MAEPVTAYRGFEGKLYATSEEADRSFSIVPFEKLRTLLGGLGHHDFGPCAYSLPDILIMRREMITEFYALLDRVGPVHAGAGRIG